MVGEIKNMFQHKAKIELYKIIKYFHEQNGGMSSSWHPCSEDEYLH